MRWFVVGEFSKYLMSMGIYRQRKASGSFHNYLVGWAPPTKTLNAVGYLRWTSPAETRTQNDGLAGNARPTESTTKLWSDLSSIPALYLTPDLRGL